MRHSIVLRLTMLVAAVISVSVLALLLILHRSTSAAFVDHQAESVTQSFPAALLEELATRLEAAYDRGGLEPVRAVAADLRRGDEDTRVSFLLLDKDLRVLASTESMFAHAAAWREPSGAIQIRAVEISGGRTAETELTALNPRALTSSGGDLFGQLVLLPRRPDEGAGEQFASTVWRSAAFWLIGVVALAMASTAYIMRQSLSPLDMLTEATRRLQKGEIPGELRPAGGSEFRRLIDAFNAATRAIAETENIRRQLISDIAHELRTPVTNLKCQLEALEAGLIEPDRDFQATMRAETRLLERLVEDFQQLAISDAGQLRLNMRTLTLPDVLETALRPLAEKNKAQLRIDVADDPPIRGDEERLRQVFGNLMENSMRHRPTGLVVDVTARRQEDRIAIFFRDNGPGVAAEDQPHIFERFYRAEKSRNRATGGAGLGLSIAKSLLAAMGGSIRYLDEEGHGDESREEEKEAEHGTGATFVIEVVAERGETTEGKLRLLQ